MFRHIFLAAFIGGALAGLAAFGVEQMWALPLILQAEVLEERSDAALPARPHHGAAEAAANGHGSAPWAPADGWERRAYTAGMHVLTGIGIGLVLVALFALGRRRVDGGRGLLWGAAAFATFALAPGLGLPPELPGQPAAPLVLRQAWWLGAVGATGGGLTLLLLASRRRWRVAGLVLLLLPHAVGAPHPDASATGPPHGLVVQFIAASLVASAVFWLVLGGVCGYLYRRTPAGPTAV